MDLSALVSACNKMNNLGIFLNFQLEIVGLNRENYETRRRVVHMSVQEKPGEDIFFYLLYYFPPLNSIRYMQFLQDSGTSG
jgi:hypothetical protein